MGKMLTKPKANKSDLRLCHRHYKSRKETYVDIETIKKTTSKSKCAECQIISEWDARCKIAFDNWMLRSFE